jgi:histidinol-phosphate/aromatic aminotransferase/cobyric acid decarboxylase-like protein
MSHRAAALRPDLDLSMNLPPQPMEADLEGRLTRGIAAIQREVGFSAHLNYRDPGGTEAERDIAAEWLRSRIPDARRDRVVICPGTQNALFNLLVALTAPGDVVLTEALTYPGIRAAAACRDVRLVGVAIDEQGILPDALDAACRKHSPKAVYLIPTIHNPTTATMPRARREQVAEILRARDVLLLEDDAYGMLAPGAVPLAALVPERTYFAATLSKCIAPGLRVSFLLTPDQDSASVLATALRATVHMPAFLMVALVTRWLQDGQRRRDHRGDPRRSDREAETGRAGARAPCIFPASQRPSHLDPVAAELEQDAIRVVRSKAGIGRGHGRSVQRRGHAAQRDSRFARRGEQPRRAGARPRDSGGGLAVAGCRHPRCLRKPRPHHHIRAIAPPTASGCEAAT